MRILAIGAVILQITIVSINTSFASSEVRAARTTFGTARAQIIQFTETITNFRHDTGRFPTQQEGLAALRNNMSNIPGWKDPYINKEIPLDPWGNNYVYYIPPKYGTKEYDLYSFGENGQDDYGQKDDITNWRKINYEYYDKYYWIKRAILAVAILIFLVVLCMWIRRFRGRRRKVSILLKQ